MMALNNEHTVDCLRSHALCSMQPTTLKGVTTKATA